MRNETEAVAITSLFSGFWQQSKRPAAILRSLQELAEGFDKTLTEGMIRLYSAALGEATEDQVVLAFTRATLECKFFPPPATLLEFSGRAALGDPVAREAKDALLELLEGMRGLHGLELKPLLGRVLYGTEDDPKDETGARTHAPIRAESIPFPMRGRVKAALLRLGWGNLAAGIEMLAQHPALTRRRDREADGAYQTNDLRRSDEILARFTQAYREVQG